MTMQLTTAQLGTLIDLVENGPLCDGELENLPACEDLIDFGMAVRILVKGEAGWTAATHTGRNSYIAQFHCETLKEALVGQEAMRVMDAVSKP